MKIRLDLGIQQDRGPSVHEIEDFDDMLLFTRRISRNAGDIFEVYLDFFKWLTPFQWLAFPASLLADASISAQDPPNRARGTRECLSAVVQSRVARQVIQDCAWSWRPLEMFWWGITDR